MKNFLISSDSTAEPSNALDEPYISVRSLWKVFGRNPERALEPEYEQHDRAAIQEELGCVVALRDVSLDLASLNSCTPTSLVQCQVLSCILMPISSRRHRRVTSPVPASML